VTSPHAEKYSYLEDVKAIDDLNIIFELKYPYAPFFTDLCGAGIVSERHCHNNSKKCGQENIGSGPYRVEKWDTAKESLRLKPFDSWFEGAPKNSILIRVVRDENTRMLELKSKKAHIVDGDISPQNAAVLEKEPHLKVTKIPGLGITYIGINVRGPISGDKEGSEQLKTRRALADKRVRQALASALDVNQAIEKVLLNKAERASGLIPNRHWAKTPNLKIPLYDPEKSKVLLDEAGFIRSSPNGSRFKLVLTAGQSRLMQNIAALFADYWRQVGIDATVRVKDFSALYQDMKKGQFEAFIATWVPVTEPDLYTWVHHSSNIPTETKAGGNRHGFRNAEVDRLIELGRKTLLKEERKALYGELENIMLYELPYILLWNENRIIVTNENIKNYKPSSTGSWSGLRHASLLGDS